ncbi:MAG TPA: glycosyltransferase [Nitrospirae bacterium]|nr:glycosyltransferase [Nitrospirota bacterium]HDK17772.1 glycosyltransferase [Nitrospirota bacterium]
MSTPVISVIMSVFNDEQYLRRSIESILGQTYRDFEFIIIDDASSDGSSEIIRESASKDRRIVVMKNPVNLGLALSLNMALNIAKGEFVARMDADDIAVENRFEVQLEFLNKNPMIDLLGSSVYLIDSNDKIIARSDAVADPGILKRIIHYRNVCAHPTWMFRKEVLKDIKEYRALPASQDYDFQMRLYSLGHEISNVGIPLLYYRMHKRKISFDRSISQIKLSRYLRRLYKRGLLLRDEYFGKEQILKVIDTHRAVRQIHSMSLSIFEKGRFLMKNNSLIRGAALLCVSALLSPYMAYFIYCGMRAKLLERKQNKSAVKGPYGEEN